MLLDEFAPAEAVAAGERQRGAEFSPLSTEAFEALPAPRLIKTHSPVPLMLPQEVGPGGGGAGKKEKLKVVVVVRDPRDVLTSSFYHAWNPSKRGWPFGAWAAAWLDGATPSGSWADWCKGWREAADANADADAASSSPYDVLLCRYEDLSSADDAVRLAALRKVGEFVLQGGASLDGNAAATEMGALTAKVDAQCRFDAMKAAAGKQAAKEGKAGGVAHLRHGRAGNWREHFGASDGGGDGASTLEELFRATVGDEAKAQGYDLSDGGSGGGGSGTGSGSAEEVAAEVERLKGLGNGAFGGGQFAEAEKFYSEALALDASVVAVWSNRAAARLRLGETGGDDASNDASNDASGSRVGCGSPEEAKLVEALRDAEACLALDPTFLKGHHRKALAQKALSLPPLVIYDTYVLANMACMKASEEEEKKKQQQQQAAGKGGGGGMGGLPKPSPWLAKETKKARLAMVESFAEWKPLALGDVYRSYDPPHADSSSSSSSFLSSSSPTPSPPAPPPPPPSAGGAEVGPSSSSAPPAPPAGTIGRFTSLVLGDAAAVDGANMDRMVAVFRRLTDMWDRLSTLAYFWNAATPKERHTIFARFLDILDPRTAAAALEETKEQQRQQEEAAAAAAAAAAAGGGDEAVMAAAAAAAAADALAGKPSLAAGSLAAAGDTIANYDPADMRPLPTENYAAMHKKANAVWLAFFAALGVSDKVKVFEAMYLLTSEEEQRAIFKDLRFFCGKDAPGAAAVAGAGVNDGEGQPMTQHQPMAPHQSGGGSMEDMD
jgi:tetratricopeptide (TPR) repeat protein